MKCLRVCMLITVLITPNNAAAAMLAKENIKKDDLVFERQIGKQSKSPIVKICKIHNGAGNDFEIAYKIFSSMKTKPLSESMHIVAKQPSLAYTVTTGKQTTTIYSDFETLKFIDSPETKKLTKLIDSMCGS